MLRISIFNAGQYLVREILAHPEMELAFVWNRTAAKIEADFSQIVLEDLADAHVR